VADPSTRVTDGQIKAFKRYSYHALKIKKYLIYAQAQRRDGQTQEQTDGRAAAYSTL